MQRKLLGLLIVLAGHVLPGPAFAQASVPASAPLSEDDPAVWAARAERAKHLREESARLRREADAQRQKGDIDCRKRFLENACKNSVRETWIEEINKVRAMEIEAVGLERNQRAHDIAMHEKAKSSASPRPPLILPELGSGPLEQSRPAPVPGGKPLKPFVDDGPPKPTAKPIDKRKQAEHAAEAQRNRDENAKAAAERAEQARKDAARYEERKKEHDRKEAERKAKAAGQATSAAAGAK